VFHVGNVFGHFAGVFILLLDDGLDAGLNVCLIIAVADSVHSVEELKSLDSHLAKLWLSRDRIVESGTQLADLVGKLFVLLEVCHFGGQ
jgi:hypothetical protein